MKIKIHLGTGEIKAFTDLLSKNEYAFSVLDDDLSVEAEEEEKVELPTEGLDSSPVVPSELLQNNKASADESRAH